MTTPEALRLESTATLHIIEMGERDVSRQRQLEVVVSGLGVVTHAGESREPLKLFGGHTVDTPQRAAPQEVEVEPGTVLPLGRLGRLKRHPFRHRFERMSQLDAFSQYAFIAAGHALDDAEITVPDPAFEEVGVFLGTCYGCQEANYRFDQFDLNAEGGPEGVRPAIFKNTVDNVPAGWLSVGYGLRGVSSTFTSGCSAGAEALLSALWALRGGRARQVVTGGVERLIDLQLAALHKSERWPAPFPAEGAAFVVLELAEAAASRGHRPRARIVDATRLPSGEPTQIVSWLEEQGYPGPTLTLSSVVAPSPERLKVLCRDLEDVGLSRSPLIESQLTGDTIAAQGPLALTLLIERLQSFSSEKSSALLCVAGEADESLLFLIESLIADS